MHFKVHTMCVSAATNEYLTLTFAVTRCDCHWLWFTFACDFSGLAASLPLCPCAGAAEIGDRGDEKSKYTDVYGFSECIRVFIYVWRAVCFFRNSTRRDRRRTQLTVNFCTFSCHWSRRGREREGGKWSKLMMRERDRSGGVRWWGKVRNAGTSVIKKRKWACITLLQEKEVRSYTCPFRRESGRGSGEWASDTGKRGTSLLLWSVNANARGRVRGEGNTCEITHCSQER